MSAVFRSLLALVLNFACAGARSIPNWTLAQSDHFEVHSEHGADAARSDALWFEQLRAAMLEQTGLHLEAPRPARVIAFQSIAEYRQHRNRETADAYYIGTNGRDYIVLPADVTRQSQAAAHEFTHLILHAAGYHLPAWLAEGLAEFYSTIRFGEGVSKVGGKLASHYSLVQRQTWIPLQSLTSISLDTVSNAGRGELDLFYAQSWALASMLVLSKGYGLRLRDFLNEISSGLPSELAFRKIYAKTPAQVESDLRKWLADYPALPVQKHYEEHGTRVKLTEVPEFETRHLLADLELANGQLDRAATAYRELAKTAPNSPDIAAALGTIALRKGDRTTARTEWRKAIEEGVEDSNLCFEYAVLAESASVSLEEIRPALTRAIHLNPSFDDARYLLALLESNAGNHEAAVDQLRAMQSIRPDRAYAYWSALANSLSELGRRDEADAAAGRALEQATTAAERKHASELRWMAQSDLTVQLTTGADGRMQMATTRVVHNAPHNPFIEPSDRIRRTEASLQAMNCGGKVLQMELETRTGRLVLSLPDPSHIQIRNGPNEFTCGAQNPVRNVIVEYAASGDGNSGIVRGIEFH